MIKKAIGVVFAFCMTAYADVYHWTGAARDGMWDNAANWQENEVPGAFRAEKKEVQK